MRLTFEFLIINFANFSYAKPSLIFSLALYIGQRITVSAFLKDLENSNLRFFTLDILCG